MADFEEPQSRNEAILQNILGADNELLPPQSRIENLLQALLEEIGGEDGIKSIVAEHSDLLIDNASKNLLNISINSGSRSGITWTVNKNSNGEVESITVNGTATNVVWIGLADIYVEKGYKLSGTPAGGGANTFELSVYPTATASANIGVDYGEGGTISATVQDAPVYIGIRKNYTANNLVFYPSITRAGVDNTQYSPYYPTVRMLSKMLNNLTERVEVLEGGSNTNQLNMVSMRNIKEVQNDEEEST